MAEVSDREPARKDAFHDVDLLCQTEPRLHRSSSGLTHRSAQIRVVEERFQPIKPLFVGGGQGAVDAVLDDFFIRSYGGGHDGKPQTHALDQLEIKLPGCPDVRLEGYHGDLARLKEWDLAVVTPGIELCFHR